MFVLSEAASERGILLPLQRREEEEKARDKLLPHRRRRYVLRRDPTHPFIITRLVIARICIIFGDVCIVCLLVSSGSASLGDASGRVAADR